MLPLPRYRSWQLAAMEKNMLNIEHLVSTIDDPAVFAKRDGGDGWNISEVLGHLADTDGYFLARARALVAGELSRRVARARAVDERVKDAGYAEQDAMDLLQRWLGVSADYHATFWLLCPKMTKNSGSGPVARQMAAASHSTTNSSSAPITTSITCIRS